MTRTRLRRLGGRRGCARRAVAGGRARRGRGLGRSAAAIGSPTTGRRPASPRRRPGSWRSGGAAAAPGRRRRRPPAAPVPAQADQGSVPIGSIARSLVRTAQLAVEAADPVAATRRVRAAVAGGGGHGRHRSSRPTGRLADRAGARRPARPADRRHRGPRPRDQPAAQVVDATEEVVDLDARVASQQASVDRVRALLARGDVDRRHRRDRVGAGPPRGRPRLADRPARRPQGPGRPVHADRRRGRRRRSRRRQSRGRRLPRRAGRRVGRAAGVRGRRRARSSASCCRSCRCSR